MKSIPRHRRIAFTPAAGTPPRATRDPSPRNSNAKKHGVEVRPVCVNASRWDCTLEPTDDESRFAVRLGMRMVKGLANAYGAAIVANRTRSALCLR
jgi:error-prone DNA polymerase